ncbi:hypothetical protein BDV93DRAFT_549213 [Ceratobasidium sp. AG-I]|nr:hypothetical protein BDV93DRAFT_549213 [Ceratobasidium sp. AG-I]
MRSTFPADRPSKDEDELSVWAILILYWGRIANIPLRHNAPHPTTPPLLVPPLASPPAALNPQLSPQSGTNATSFTRRPVRQIVWRTTQTNGILSLVNHWHENEYGYRDLEFRVTRGISQLQKLNEPLWEATPIIFGELHPQYAGRGTSIVMARTNAAQKIADSGHCCPKTHS